MLKKLKEKYVRFCRTKKRHVDVNKRGNVGIFALSLPKLTSFTDGKGWWPRYVLQYTYLMFTFAPQQNSYRYSSKTSKGNVLRYIGIVRIDARVHQERQTLQQLSKGNGSGLPGCNVMLSILKDDRNIPWMLWNSPRRTYPQNLKVIQQILEPTC